MTIREPARTVLLVDAVVRSENVEVCRHFFYLPKIIANKIVVGAVIRGA
jgi:hypothetical protein